MEPAFQRGDLLFLWNRAPRAELGEVVVYNVQGKDIPIVHRVVRTFPEVDSKTKKVKDVSKYVYLFFPSPLLKLLYWSLALTSRNISSETEPSHMLLTKGDNNIADDVELYARGQDYLNYKRDIVGSVRGYIPMVGYVTIMISEHPWLKSVLLGIMGLMVILQRE